MSANTKIEWCDHTLNGWVGCTPVSPGCTNCYAAQSMPARFFGITWGAGQPRHRTSASTWAAARRWNRQHADFYAKHGRRQRVFGMSLADVFDNEVDFAWRVDYFRLILETPNLDHLILTKRIGNAWRMIEDVRQALRDEGLEVPAWPWANVWLGATVVNQEEADRDIGKLLATKAVVHFLSIEPMLGAIDLEAACRCAGLHLGEALDWVIVGGESGPQARALHPVWVREVQRQCAAAGVAFFFKQWGHWRPIDQGAGDWYDGLYRSRRKAREGEDQSMLDDLYGRRCTVPQAVIQRDGSMHEDLAASNLFRSGTDSLLAFAVGKERAGRLLDGREWNEFPPDFFTHAQDMMSRLAAART